MDNTHLSTAPQPDNMATLTLTDEVSAALSAAIQPKLAEFGWTDGADDSALAEYIALMLANGKTQEQIAAELSGELLSLGPDDPGAQQFSAWLFETAQILVGQHNGAQVAAPSGNQGQQNGAEGGDQIMGEAMDTGDIPNAYVQPRHILCDRH